MNAPPIWLIVQGHDTDGLSIFSDLRRLQNGEMDDEGVGELMSDLVRESRPSTAGYAALPLLLEAAQTVAASVRLEILHAASLILGLADEPRSPPVPQLLKGSFSLEARERVLAELLRAASEAKLSDADVVCIASAAFLLKGRKELYYTLCAEL